MWLTKEIFSGIGYIHYHWSILIIVVITAVVQLASIDVNIISICW